MNNKSQLLKDLKEFRKAVYTIDTNNAFYNFGPMANKAYNRLIPEQSRIITDTREQDELNNFVLEGHDENSTEFLTYPEHAKRGTKQAQLIPEFYPEQFKPNTLMFYKNSINGMFNRDLQETIRQLKNLREVVFQGVCADLCVMDFARGYSRYLDEINHPAKLFVVKSAIDTYDAPDHNREEWLNIAYKVMAQAGIEIVENADELFEKEKRLGLR